MPQSNGGHPASCGSGGPSGTDSGIHPRSVVEHRPVPASEQKMQSHNEVPSRPAEAASPERDSQAGEPEVILPSCRDVLGDVLDYSRQFALVSLDLIVRRGLIWEFPWTQALGNRSFDLPPIRGGPFNREGGLSGVPFNQGRGHDLERTAPPGAVQLVPHWHIDERAAETVEALAALAMGSPLTSQPTSPAGSTSPMDEQLVAQPLTSGSSRQASNWVPVRIRTAACDSCDTRGHAILQRCEIRGCCLQVCRSCVEGGGLDDLHCVDGRVHGLDDAVFTWDYI